MNSRAFLRLIVCVGCVIIGATLVDGAGDNYTASDSFWDFAGGQDNGQAAESIAKAGDVNGDGYKDLIVGARQYNNGASDSGIAWVFYGSDNGYSQTPDVTLDPPEISTNGFFGTQVGPAGDVNDDGYADVMVSMINYGGLDDGAVFVYYGSDGALDPNYDWMCRANVTYAHLGWGMDTAGDVNGDNYDDIIVGGVDYFSNNWQGAMVFHGSATGLDANGTRPEGNPSNADWVVHSDQVGAWFGFHVGTAGDVDGDGYHDIWIGAPYYNMGQADEGVLFLWYGSAAGLGASPTTPASADWYVESNQVNARLTGELYNPEAGRVGDVNGDGYDEVMVGARLYDIDGTDRGIAMVFYGSQDGMGPNGNPDNADWIASGENDSDYLGCPAMGAGDINDDGFDDVMVGSYGWDEPGPDPPPIDDAGMVAIWYGGEDGLPRDGQPHWADVLIKGEQSGARFGQTIAKAEDVNDDGPDDIVVGALFYQDTLYREGAAFAFYGAPITFMDDFETGDTLRWSGEVE